MRGGRRPCTRLSADLLDHVAGAGHVLRRLLAFRRERCQELANRLVAGGVHQPQCTGQRLELQTHQADGRCGQPKCHQRPQRGAVLEGNQAHAGSRHSTGRIVEFRSLEKGMHALMQVIGSVQHAFERIASGRVHVRHPAIVGSFVHSQTPLSCCAEGAAWAMQAAALVPGSTSTPHTVRTWSMFNAWSCAPWPCPARIPMHQQQM